VNRALARVAQMRDTGAIAGGAAAFGVSLSALPNTPQSVQLTGGAGTATAIINYAKLTHPTAACAVADGGAGNGPSAGDVLYGYTYVGTNMESSPSPLVHYTAPGGKNASLSGITTGPGGTTSRNIYRCIAGQTQLRLVGNLAGNVATTYTDSVLDGALAAVTFNKIAVAYTGDPGASTIDVDAVI
jgi:hypothetical protein